MGIFGRSKKRLEQAQREAAEEFEQAMARAKPPTDAERTWALPAPDASELGLGPARRPRSAGRSQPQARFPLGADAPEGRETPGVPETPDVEPVGDSPGPATPSAGPAAEARPAPSKRSPAPGAAPRKRRAPAAKAPGTAKATANGSRATTKKQPPGTRNRRPT